ncbi:hypothetical protein LUZ60_010540 [Juncus effusus]|nr:hypothetical protein LUZ60_010540 [Juncus effusus]
MGGNDHNEKLEFIEEMTKNADKVQEKVLREILTRNANTEYLNRYKMDGANDRETFKARIPVVTYEDLKPDIERIAEGDKSAILTADPISEFFTSSGTSAGERKLIPVIKEEVHRILLLLSLLTPVINLNVPGLDKGKGLYFYFAKSETKTTGGLLAQPITTSLYKNKNVRNRPLDPYNIITSPYAAIICLDSFQSMYVQMLCGLIYHNEVLRVGAVFANGLLHAIKFLTQHWSDLARDIETGTLNKSITDKPVRESVQDILKPDPNLAKFISDECKDENWNGIITRIWPNAKYLDVIVTGTMAQYIPTLEYYSGGLPMVCKAYGSSECFFGLNLKPMCKPDEVSYTIMPNMCYYEFIPLETSFGDEINNNSLVDLVNVEVGKEYEVVVTTYSGLYRYRVGDVLQATGFHNAAPQFKFIKRKNVLLSINTDKTDEPELQKAMQHVSDLIKPYGASIVEYTSCTDTSTIPGHYVIYWELLVKEGGKWPEKEVFEKCCSEMEEELNIVYREGRASGVIGPLEIRVLKRGSFEELMHYAISRGASNDQYKTPKCVSFPPIIELLNSWVISTHFSPACPKWSPHRKEKK